MGYSTSWMLVYPFIGFFASTSKGVVCAKPRCDLLSQVVLVRNPFTSFTTH